MKPDRAHEQNAWKWLKQLDGVSGRQFATAVVGAAIAHAILDLAQAIREGHVRG